MKKLWIVMLCLLLTGCSEPVLETVSDVYETLAPEPCKQMILQLPSDAAVQTMDSESGSSLFLGENYWIATEVFPAGDLTGTLRSATGYDPEKLQVFRTVQPDGEHYDCVFTSSSEDGDLVGRVCIVDDGAYHYVLTAMVSEESAAALQTGELSALFDAFHVADPETIVSTGS